MKILENGGHCRSADRKMLMLQRDTLDMSQHNCTRINHAARDFYEAATPIQIDSVLC